MALERVPNVFDNATHERLDAAVNKDAAESEYLPYDGPLTTISHHAELLHYIIHRSDGSLDPQHYPLVNARKIVNTRPELRDMLSSAWERKSYREIRNLAILKVPLRRRSSGLKTKTTEELHHDLSESFKAQYHGAAIEGFYEYLTHNESLFRSHQMAYYAKFCSVVQSSGTGKSRLFIELCKKNVVVLYMNLREASDVDSFPPRDQIPANILCKAGSEKTYQIKCYAFLLALLEALDEQLSTPTNATALPKEKLMSWVRDMCDLSLVPQTTARADFFGKLLEKYEKFYDDYDQMSKETKDKSSPSSQKVDAGVQNDDSASGVEQVTAKMQEMSIAESKMFPRLSDVCHSVGTKLNRIFGDDSERPKLVVALDEAHPLTPMESSGAQSYRPADVLCRIISKYSQASTGKSSYPIWVVFASTTSKVADFSPPNHKHNSSRVYDDGQLLFPPYTQLGWDQGAPQLGQIDIEDISSFDHLSGFGRPLWQSVRPHQAAGHVQKLAESKLCGNAPFNPQNTRHALAVLGQRFGLNVTMGHPDSIAYLETGVASHLRVCLSTTSDRIWRFTSYPSEPFLSHAAACILHRNRPDLVIALSTLYSVVNSGMIDVGQRGELASRLLWLLGKDLYVRSGSMQESTVEAKGWTEHALDCIMIRVVDWLEFIFGPKIWHGNQGSLARDMFKDAYLNFSHWVCMDAVIAGSKDGDEIETNEWTLRHFQRTSAVQCCHQQKLIDKVIPIYFKGDSDGARVSHIFISDKARKSSSKDVLNHITRRDKSLPGNDTDSRPYIAILADLAQPSSFSVTFPERETSDRCLRIYAGGIDEETYPFLAEHPKLMGVLRDFVHLQQIPETQWPYTRYLNAQVKYGSTATAEHMHWERGKACPDLRGPTI